MVVTWHMLEAAMIRWVHCDHNRTEIVSKIVHVNIQMSKECK